MWFYAALSMALISGFITIISKHSLKTISPLILYWTVLAVSTPIIFIFAWKNGIPSLDFIFVLSILGSVIFYSISRIVFFKTIKDAELSHVHPLIALSPLITLALSTLILSEKISIIGFLGIGITILGTYVLNISSMRESLLEPFKILFRNKLSSLMLISVVAGGITPVFDKLGISHTFPQNLYFTLFIQDFVIVLVFLPWILTKIRTVSVEIKNSKKILLLLGVLGAMSNILAFIALQNGNPGLVASVFRTQVFFVLLFSFIFFKDKPKTETIIGSIIMIAGLVIIKLWS